MLKRWLPFHSSSWASACRSAASDRHTMIPHPEGSGCRQSGGLEGGTPSKKPVLRMPKGSGCRQSGGLEGGTPSKISVLKPFYVGRLGLPTPLQLMDATNRRATFLRTPAY